MSDALEIANRLEGVRVREHYDLIPKTIAADELRRQHAEIESLRAQLAARVPDDERAAFCRWANARTMNTRTNSAGAYAIHEVSAAWEAWQARAMLSAAPSQQAPVSEQKSTMDGKVLVPLRMNAEMERVAQEEGWSWADMLAAAEATTLEQDAIARDLEASQQATETTELRSVVFKVLEGWTLPHDVRSILEIAYYSQQAPVAQGEPVYQTQSYDGRWIDQERSSYDYNVRNGHTGRVLYTHPQQPIEPVTDEQIKEEWFHIHNLNISTLEKVILLARAVERLHGIRE